MLQVYPDTALLQWISEEYAVQAYTTADRAVSYLNHVRVARLHYAARLQPNVAKTQYDQCEPSVV